MLMWLSHQSLATNSQFISNHKGTSGHPQVQATVLSADQPEYSQRGRTISQMMCWIQAHWAGPLRLGQALSTLCPCWASMPARWSHWHQHYCWSSMHSKNPSQRESCNYCQIHPCGIPASSRWKPAAFLPSSSPSPCTPLHPTTQFFTGRMPFLPPNHQCQSTEGKGFTSHSTYKKA